MLANRSPKAVALSAMLTGVLLFLTLPAFAQRAAISDRSADEKSKRESVTATPSAPSEPVKAKTSPWREPQLREPQLREPTRDEVEVLLEGMAPYLSTSTEGLQPVRHDNGAVSLDLQGRFQNITIARIEADGSISQQCVTSKAEARQFLTQGARKPATKPAPASGPASVLVTKDKPALEEK